MSTLTPAMQQYVDLKKQYPDCILFFRLGDFYEVFREDAQLCSKLLDLVLTAKNKTSDHPIPMAGMPYHSIDKYIAKLIKAWYKIALADQIGDVKPWQLVQRRITSIITPATYIDESKRHSSQSNNDILAISTTVAKEWEILYHLCRWSFVDAVYQTMTIEHIDDLHRLLHQINPREIILHKTAKGIETIGHTLPTLNQAVISYRDMLDDPETYLLTVTKIQSLSSYGEALTKWRVYPTALLLHYIAQTQQSSNVAISRLSLYRPEDYVILDDMTIKNLEIFTSHYDHDHRVSLYGTLDVCQTRAGSKLLRHILIHPLRDLTTIQSRLDHIQHYVDHSDRMLTVRQLLGQLIDIHSCLTTILYKAPSYHPCIRLRKTLDHILNGIDGRGISQDLLSLGIDENIQKQIAWLLTTLSQTFKDDDRLALKAEDYIADGFDTTLDEIRDLLYHSDRILLDYRQRLVEHTGVADIKIIYVTNQWYMIDVTPKHIATIESKKTDDSDYNFIRMQTLKTGQRYMTETLDGLQKEILSARDRADRRQGEILTTTQQIIADHHLPLRQLADAIAWLDIYTSMARYAREHRYICPEIITSWTLLGQTIIDQGRHPVIEAHLDSRESFIPNDLTISQGKSKDSLHIITWPNMGGKSTYLRQNALIILMAQCGLRVPATRAQISLVDGIFARVGSGDVIAKRQSTFMTEMIEVANIIHNASEKSFIIFDELGRGTSTYDGIALTRAIIEYVVTHIGAQTLFATHYHELITLADHYPQIHNYHVGVYESDHEVIFLKKIMPGGMDKSYGIDVAKLAGIPHDIIDQARGYLDSLHGSVSPKASNDSVWKMHSSVVLFSDISSDNISNPLHEKVITLLQETKINNLTPIQAMQLLIKCHEILHH